MSKKWAEETKLNYAYALTYVGYIFLRHVACFSCHFQFYHATLLYGIRTTYEYVIEELRKKVGTTPAEKGKEIGRERAGERMKIEE